jgi:ADP-ribose pyrophosphatase YjhB (NUDIX family)
VVLSEIIVCHAQQQHPQWWDAALFLAGPTPRDPAVASWRPEALNLLRQRWPGGRERAGRLVVFVPEAPGGGLAGTWSAQVAWEDESLHRADAIAFWVPREPTTLPGFTTNVEWGRWENSGKVVFGAPGGAPHTKYLRHYADQHAGRSADSLAATLDHALALLDPGRPADAERRGSSRRAGGERDVPLHVWRTGAFQGWYLAQRAAGNELRSARQIWPGGPAFFWALRVAVWVAAENRVKDNEIVLSRPDVVSVALHGAAPSLPDTPVVLVREFRAPARTPDGYLRELPGGSGAAGAGARDLAVAEVREETGLILAPDRLRAHSARQVAGTVSAHHAELFTVALTDDELARLRADAAAGRAHGVAADTERTFVEVRTLGEILAARDVDWVTLGQLAQALLDPAD